MNAPRNWTAGDAAANARHFDRLLAVVLPLGGAAVVVHEGYFDESGDIENEEKIFCIAGYYKVFSRKRNG